MSGSSSWASVAEIVKDVDSSGSSVRSDSEGTLTYSDPSSARAPSGSLASDSSARVMPSAVSIGSRERQKATWRLDSSMSEVLVIRPEMVIFWSGSARSGRAGLIASMLIRAQDSGSAARAPGATSSRGTDVAATSRIASSARTALTRVATSPAGPRHLPDSSDRPCEIRPFVTGSDGRAPRSAVTGSADSRSFVTIPNDAALSGEIWARRPECAPALPRGSARARPPRANRLVGGAGETRLGSSPVSGAERLSRAQATAVTELLRIAPVADRLGLLFAKAGFTLYLVGGSVRDALRGELGHDLDFTTDARPDDIEQILRTVTPTVWTIGKEFGTVGCRVDEPAASGSGVESWVIEVTTFRSDVYVADSRKPQVRFGDTLEGDLVRRDFTVNAMAVELPSKRFVDPYGGLAHLAEGLIDTPATAGAVLLRRPAADDAGRPLHLPADVPAGTSGGRGHDGDGRSDRDRVG